MARKHWHVKEFTGKSGLGLGVFREKMARDVCAFLDQENLAPSGCIITWHTERDERAGSETIIAQVFYER